VGIDWFRDLAIVVLGFGVTLVVIVIGILAVMMYCKLKPVLNSAKSTAKRVENISATIEEEVSRPLAQLAAFIQGIRQAAGFFSGFAKRK
jgi:Na+-transporting methylmalonyl-CoA/oxaloacetate decarboxylase gamma subunit